VTAPLRLERSVNVRVSQDRAFRVWTEQVGLWWPPGHSATGEPGARMAFEAGVGGRLLETAPSGRLESWGEITRWDPPNTLAYTFFAGAPPGQPSQVEVTFQAVAPTLTRVLVTHRPGALPAEAWTGTVKGFVAGWAAALPSFASFIHESPSPEPS